MDYFKDRTAVIAGAGRGIGRSIALRCAREGMNVVLASRGAEALHRTATELEALGASVLAMQADVSRLEEVAAIAENTLRHFGAVHLLVNNAGIVTSFRPIWEQSEAEWDQILGVNVVGVVNGVRVFVPIMLSQAEECHIVNVSSVAGIKLAPHLGPYTVTKHAVTSLSEVLYQQLAAQQSRIGVSVLCPGHVRTDILSASRNRSPAAADSPEAHETAPEWLSNGIRNGMSPDAVADALFLAIQRRQLYVLTHPAVKEEVSLRAENIVQERNP